MSVTADDKPRAVFVYRFYLLRGQAYMRGVYFQQNAKLPCTVRKIRNVQSQIKVRVRNNICMTLFRRRHERFGVAPRSRFPAETFEKDMPRKSVHRRNSLVVPKNNDIIFAAVLRDIAFTEIHYVAFQAAQHADTSVKLPTQFRKLRVQPLQFFPADAVIHVAARMFADRNRLKSEWGLSDLQMRDILNADALDLIEETVKAGAKAAGARKWWLGELSREANAKGVSLEELPITPADVAEVEKLIADGKLNDKLAKQTVEGVLKGEGTPDEVVKKHDYKIVEDNGAIEAAVDAAFEANPDVVEKLKSGNMKPMGVIIGAVMKATRGQADAKAVTKIVMGKIK